MRSLLVLLAFGQVVSGSCYRYAFDATVDVTGAIQCFANSFNVGFVHVFDKGNVIDIGVNNYKAAANYFGSDFIELVVKLDSKKSGDEQAKNFLNKFGDGNYHKSVWVDLTNSAEWGSDTKQNFDIINAFLNSVSAGQSQFSTGVLTSYNENQKIIGSNGYSNTTRIWYQGDSNQNMCDYVPISGQYIPNAKMYAPNQNVCGVTINLNIYVADQAKLVSAKPTKMLPRCNQ